MTKILFIFLPDNLMTHVKQQGTENMQVKLDNMSKWQQQHHSTYYVTCKTDPTTI